MNSITVRVTEPSDLPRLSELTESIFGVRRDASLLRWLLENPRCPEQIDSWVAVRDNEVIGHMAALKSHYCLGTRRVTGAHAFLWMVDPRFRGDAGMALGRKILGRDDFLIVLGGSAMTKAILSSRRFEQVTEAKEFRIVREPTGMRNGFDLVSRHSGIGERTAASDRIAVPEGIIANEASAAHLEWLAGCPDLEAHLLDLESGGRPVGPVLLFVNRLSTPVSGRVVHIPFLGEDPRSWLQGLEMFAEEFRRLECPSWTVLASHPALIQACEASGARLTGSRPVWIRPKKREQQVELESVAWHLTYLEGDLAYRKVQAK